MHKVYIRLTKGAPQEHEDIVFIEADAKWVHYPYIDTLAITVKIANNIVHRMLVDNGSAVNILFWDAYEKIGLTKNDLRPMTSTLYGFTGIM